MYPILLSVGPIHFYSYGLCLAVALGLSIYCFARDTGKYIAPKMRLTYEQGFQEAFDLGIYVIISSLIGARIFYVIENHAEFGNGRWLDALKIWQGGLVYYGGFFGALAAGITWVIREKWPLSYCCDLVAPYILLGQAIGRVGCFLNGCCYGDVSVPHQGLLDWGHGWVFQGGEDQQPHLPTQLWEMGGDFALFFLLLWARRWTIRSPWLSLCLYGLTYGILRFVIEIWRLPRTVHLFVDFRSASQATSAILIILSAAAIIGIIIKGGRKSPAPPGLE